MKSNRTLAMATFAMSYSLRWQLFLILVALLRVLVRSAGLVSVLLVLVDVYFLVDCASPRLQREHVDSKMLLTRTKFGI